MSLAELLPAIRALPRAEKAELLHLLVDDVTAPVMTIGTTWPIEARFDFEAAKVLQELLEQCKTGQVDPTQFGC